MNSKRGQDDGMILARRFFAAGDMIIKAGDKGDLAYLIQSGAVRVFLEKDGKQVDLGRLKTGQIIGEMALFNDAPRSASVQATEDCNVILIDRITLRQKLEKSDPTIRALVPMLIKRITQGNDAMFSRGQSIEAMIDTINTIYDNMQQDLPNVQRKTLQNMVQGKLEDFIAAIRSFQAKYRDNP